MGEHVGRERGQAAALEGRKRPVRLQPQLVEAAAQQVRMLAGDHHLVGDPLGGERPDHGRHLDGLGPGAEHDE